MYNSSVLFTLQVNNQTSQFVKFMQFECKRGTKYKKYVRYMIQYMYGNSGLFVISNTKRLVTPFSEATFSLSVPTVKKKKPFHTQTRKLQSVSQLAQLGGAGACLRLKNKLYRHLVSEALCLYSSFQR